MTPWQIALGLLNHEHVRHAYCNYCGSKFDRECNHPKQLYCSAECRTKAQRVKDSLSKEPKPE